MNRENLTIEKILQIKSLDDYSDRDAIQLIGKIQDFSYERKFKDGMDHALTLAGSIKDRNFLKFNSALLNYTIANIWFDRYKLLNPGKSAWKWDCEDYDKTIIHYRKGLRDLDDLAFTKKHEKELFCQINTNLANLLSHLGREIEAIEYWKNCLLINKDFGMAEGNLGHGYLIYAKIFYDPGHRAVFLKNSYKLLKKSLEKEITEEAYNGFNSLIQFFESNYKNSFLNDDVNYDDWKLGESKEEIEYRKWCLSKNLFLNSLNDLGNCSIAARDVLHLPDIIMKIDKKPFHHGLFNVIKQEYISARYLLFEARKHAQRGEVHFADKDNKMVETLDYSFHSIGIEKKKLAFRMAYSIFDKIAYFMNEYFKLGITHKKVKFRTIWYNKIKKENGIREEFDNYENWPLRGLFWLSKDLFEGNDEFKNCLEPDAKELNDIRNHLEHKYLKVHMFGTHDSPPFSSDDLSYSISRDGLYEKTLKLLKLSRAAIMYLSFSVHREEQIRKKDIDTSKIAPIVTTELFDDLRF